MLHSLHSLWTPFSPTKFGQIEPPKQKKLAIYKEDIWLCCVNSKDASFWYAFIVWLNLRKYLKTLFPSPCISMQLNMPETVVCICVNRSHQTSVDFWFYMFIYVKMCELRGFLFVSFCLLGLGAMLAQSLLVLVLRPLSPCGLLLHFGLLTVTVFGSWFSMQETRLFWPVCFARALWE